MGLTEKKKGIKKIASQMGRPEGGWAGMGKGRPLREDQKLKSKNRLEKRASSQEKKKAGKKDKSLRSMEKIRSPRRTPNPGQRLGGERRRN